MWNRYESRGATPLPAGGTPRLTSRCAVGDGAPHVGAPSTRALRSPAKRVAREGGRGRRTSGEGAAAARSRPSRQGSHPTPRRPMRTGRTNEVRPRRGGSFEEPDQVASIPPCSGATNAGARATSSGAPGPHSPARIPTGSSRRASRSCVPSCAAREFDWRPEAAARLHLNVGPGAAVSRAPSADRVR